MLVMLTQVELLTWKLFLLEMIMYEQLIVRFYDICFYRLYLHDQLTAAVLKPCSIKRDVKMEFSKHSLVP